MSRIVASIRTSIEELQSDLTSIQEYIEFLKEEEFHTRNMERLKNGKDIKLWVGK